MIHETHETHLIGPMYVQSLSEQGWKQRELPGFAGLHPYAPEANPLRLFLATLQDFHRLPESTFVLPSHKLPFYGLQSRIDELVAHHGTRLDIVRRTTAKGASAAEVLTAIRDSFLKTKGPLAERLLAAIQAGEAAGGQANGRLSAALLVRTIEGGWQDVDFRVDAAAAPITELERLLGMRRANDAMIGAERAWRKGNKEETVRYMTKATLLGPGWDRIWRRITRLSLTMGDTDRACRAFATFATSEGTSGLFISTGLKSGCFACSSSESARPSQK